MIHQLKCKQCGKVKRFTGESVNVLIGIAIAAGWGEADDLCPECREADDKARVLRRAIKDGAVVLPPNDRQLAALGTCPICHEHFPSLDKMRRHIIKAH